MWTESDEDCLCRTLGTDPTRCPYTDPVSGGCRGQRSTKEDAGKPPLPDWAEILRTADKVQVQVSSYVEQGHAYSMFIPGDTQHTVVCHPQDHQEVKNLLYHLRGPIKALVEDWG